MKIMKNIALAVALLLLAAAAFSWAAVQPGEDEAAKKEQEMAKKWQEFADPGENHKHLRYFVGDWQSVQKTWTGPGRDPIISKQQITVRSVFGGRFIESHIREQADGELYEIKVVVGFDNYRKEFVSVAYNNSATIFYINRGQLDESGKVRIDTGSRDNIFTGVQYRIKAVTTIVDEDKYTYELYNVSAAGKEIKTMEVVYSRLNK